MAIVYPVSQPSFLKNNASKNVIFICVLISLFYAIILTLLPMDVFQDRDNYLNYANSSRIILERNLNDGFLPYLTNEPVWLYLNVLISSIFGGENTVRFIIFFSSFLVSYSFLRIGYSKTSLFILILVLLMPQVLKNHTTHLRQGVAVAIFIFAFLVNNRFKYLLLFMTPFIHASFFFLLPIYIFSELIKKYKFSGFILSPREVMLLYIIFTFLLTFLFPYIIQFSGARQAEQYVNVLPDGSGLGFLIWSVFFFLFILQSSNWIRNEFYSLFSVGFYLSTYFTLAVTARVFESAFLFVFLSMFSTRKDYRLLFIVLCMILFISQWFLLLK
ncbi:EpsG family protein [Limnobaculum xujianqingii]|uniref:EpsG family protein n=1 Tax=Limnobaculum xujianqingii TaxID=2738837 RepID=UPI00112BA619|nr:EpsG family protein [Limnobaculum xujianqingii]